MGTVKYMDAMRSDDGIGCLLVGSSDAMVELRALVRRMASSSAPVLICGPSGAGKEVVARSLHYASTRAGNPFVALNCGAISPELIESELFGHERGAFTGAHSRRVGRFEAANGGTLFLDEIGDMRCDMQVRLLRVLEEQAVTRVGGAGPVPVDVRIVSATHRDLAQAIGEERFREDLFFRLGVVVLRVPALAERCEDIPMLIAHFEKAREPSARCQFTSSAMERLMAHEWRGNVRELRNVIERTHLLFAGQQIDSDAIEIVLRGNWSPPQDKRLVQLPRRLHQAPFEAQTIDLRAQLETLELEQIRLALVRAEGVIAEAARLLSLKRTTLIEKMRKYGVEKIAA